MWLLSGCAPSRPLSRVQAREVPPQGDIFEVSWQGGHPPWILRVEGPQHTSFRLNGQPYRGPVTLNHAPARLELPPNFGPPLRWTLRLTSGRHTLLLHILQPTTPLLWVASEPGLLTAYPLPGLNAQTPPLRTLHLRPNPTTLAFDPQGDLWIGGAPTCAQGYLEELSPPYRRPRFFRSLPLPVFSLAFSPHGQLWIGMGSGFCGSLPEVKPMGGSPLELGPYAYGAPSLAFGPHHSLWVSLTSTFDGPQAAVIRFRLPSRASSAPFFLDGSASGPLAFDQQGTLYTFANAASYGHRKLYLQFLQAGHQKFHKLVPIDGYGIAPDLGALAFDAQGRLWIAESSGVYAYASPLRPNAQPELRLDQLSEPTALALWPIPKGLPLW
jgi:streptogramin lyase